MGKESDLKKLEEMFGMEQGLDIPMKDRFHKNLTEEELQNLTEVKNYPAEDTGDKHKPPPHERTDKIIKRVLRLRRK